ncbi:MAG: aminotransferase class I/II-fold pyridoxal phosphate-dependent enzyme [Congregibacter sp.]
MAEQLPVCDVLLVSADLRWSEQLLSQLQSYESTHSDEQRVCRLRFLRADDLESALRESRDNGSLQSVVMDGASISDFAPALEQLHAQRSELDLFLAVPGGGVAAEPSVEISLVDREDSRADTLLRRLRSAIARRARTPFADTLRDYVEGARDAWHTPGHSSGDGLRESPWVAGFYRMMGEHVFNADLSVSVQELDSLLDPSHVIQEAQELAAEAFGARKTFFVTGGTSMANKVVVQHVLGGGGKMLVDQACHKSIHHAAILFGVDPVYLPASVNRRFGLYGPVPKSAIFAAIDAHPDAKLLVLTSSSYDGFYYDLPPIIAHAHAAGIKVLIDEAWYAHGFFHPQLRPCALESGADFVTQSTHKMLSAFSQASMLHVREPDFDEGRFREHINMHTSTSPQYALIASLDVARKQMSMEGYARLSQSIAYARQLRDGLEKLGTMRALSLEEMLPGELADDDVRLDPTKLTIDVSGTGMSATKIQRMLYEQHSIQIEKVTHNTLSILVTLGATRSKVLRLIAALERIARTPNDDDGEQSSDGADDYRVLPPLAPMRLSPREAYFGPTELIALSRGVQGLNRALIGRSSADQIVPYPPGIPVLVPGQELTEAVLEFLMALMQSDASIELHGIVRREGRVLLRVVREAA